MKSFDVVSTLKIVFIFIAVAVVGYFLGVYTLFTHTAFEIFYYLLYFVCGFLLTNGLIFVLNKCFKNE